MDKNILHSVLETVTSGQTININFTDPFAELTGDYLVLQSKTGRGRGGSRVLEIQSVTDSTRVLTSLLIDGKDKSIGTGTSEFIATLTVDGKVHGLEDATETARKVRSTVQSDDQPSGTVKTRAMKRPASQNSETTTALIAHKVATALGTVLAENPKSVFKLTGRNSGSHITGEWQVMSFTHEDNVLRMECVDTQNAERTLSFDSSVDGMNLKDAEIVFTS
jgi:hypothetical protein